MTSTAASADGVVLLHGIFRTRRCMRPLERRLQEAGYRTLNLGYPSIRHPIETLAEHIRPDVEAFESGLAGRLHFIGYSMGGLLARAYIHRFRPARLGRVVTLGTPNQGSEVADFVKDWWLYKKLYGPAGQQLTTGFEDAGRLFGHVDYELGSIAGTRSLDPLGSWILGKPGDGKVSIESTKIEGMTDHALVRTDHAFFPTNRQAQRQALHFLSGGKFEKG